MSAFGALDFSPGQWARLGLVPGGWDNACGHPTRWYHGAEFACEGKT